MRLIDADDVKDLLNGLDSLPWEEEVDELVNRLPKVEAFPKEKLKEIVERLKTIEDALFNQRTLMVDVHIDKDELQTARNLLYQEIAYNNAIEIVKEVGGLNE